MKIPVADFEKSAAAPKDWPPDGPPEVAFAGRSNVGKSSLINVLVDRKGLVRTSNTPGRTRLINFFNVEVMAPAVDSTPAARHLLRLVDLPGFGYAKVSKVERATWRPLIERYLSERQSLKVVVLLVDARRGAEIDETELAPWLAGRRLTIIPVVTKSDKLAKHERKLAAEKIAKSLGPIGKPILFSAMTGEGREEVWKRVLRQFQSVD